MMVLSQDTSLQTAGQETGQGNHVVNYIERVTRQILPGS
jgi:hypothetical protein